MIKTLVVLILVAGVVILRLNVPENNADEAYSPNRDGGVMGEMADKLLYSKAVADWQYRDFLLVKFACSEPLKVRLIALPFGSWKEHERDIESCDI